jgi:hypothetical protein
MSANRPARLTLGFGVLHLNIEPDAADPWILRIEAKATADIDRALTRTYANTRGHELYLREPEQNGWRLWLGCTVVELLPEHVQRARDWVAAYTDWLNTRPEL